MLLYDKSKNSTFAILLNAKKSICLILLCESSIVVELLSFSNQFSDIPINLLCDRSNSRLISLNNCTIDSSYINFPVHQKRYFRE